MSEEKSNNEKVTDKSEKKKKKAVLKLIMQDLHGIIKRIAKKQGVKLTKK